MVRQLSIVVEQDHIESITKSNGISAISELLWNALDADATDIKIDYKKNAIGKYEEIIINDNGHGLEYEKAQEVFKKLGGSEKKVKLSSPKGRSYHGKEGKGRYKAFSIGSLVEFESIFNVDGKSNKFTIKIDQNNLKHPTISDLEIIKKTSSGFTVRIYNVIDKVADESLKVDNRRELEEKFALYKINYPEFSISINSIPLDFDTLIKSKHEESITKDSGEATYRFNVKVIEWTFDNKKKSYFCNVKGIPFLETSLGIRSSLPISIFIESVYIEKLHRDNVLNIAELDVILAEVFAEAKAIARKYIRERLHYYSKEFINELKSEGIYPYKDDAKEEIEIAKRQVFDIVALNINEYLPTFHEQDNTSKKFTLSLVKEALEKDSTSLQKILTEVIGLPQDKREDLSDLLDKTSLVNVIDTMTEITNRLDFINALELLIYDPEHSKNVKERKHLHKILVNETWIFGEEYAYGADDLTLKNVLKEYLKFLGRDDFEEIVSAHGNDELQTIPDVCLWKRFKLGKNDRFENLVIELKKPSVDAGTKELGQIKSYCQKVINDARFPKDKTKWKFVLLTRDIKDEIEIEMQQQDREYGHILSNELYDVFVIKWGDILHSAKSRYQYVKEKLNLNFQTNHDALNLLRDKYKQYLPDQF